jgi:hypothetical protein
MKHFIVKIIGISAFLALAGWLVFSLFLSEYYLPILPFTLLFFLIVTILVHAWQLKMAKKDVAKFTRSNMLVTFYKLIIYSVFAIVYIAIKPENALIFVISLFFLYLVFSFFEVVELSKISNKK